MQVPAEAQYTLMKRAGQYLCVSTIAGEVHVVDSGTLAVEKQFKGNTGSINDMDAKGDYLATVDWHPNQSFVFGQEQFIYVYSLKTLAKMAPLHIPSAGWAFIRMHPRMSTTAFLASQTGQVQLIDLMNPGANPIHRHIDLYGSYLTGFEMAPSGEAFAMTDNNCRIRLWGSPSKARFPEYSNPTEFADAALPLPTMDWSLDT